MMKKNVVLGMSGGVDSSVSALLLKEQGYNVTAVFMKNWEEDDTDEYCHAAEDLKDVESICKQLDIPLHTVNFAAEYWDNVFTYFLTEYKAGRTPNPDILCNKEIKFKAFWEYAQKLGADFIATGHYAQIIDNALHKGLDNSKDQSYFLHAINPEIFSHILFPVGNIEKSKVREIAEKNNFINSKKKDSTGICFIGERKFKDFLKKYLPAIPGNIKTVDGKVIGKHDGLMYHTLGQRQGLNIGGVKGAKEEPWYVVSKDLNTNELLVAQGTNHPLLFSKTLIAEQIHWLDKPKEDTFSCMAKVRYRQQDQECEVEINEQCIVKFKEPQRAVTPGQFVVFYQGTKCLGGGIITKIS